MSRLSPVIGSARMGVVYGTERPIDRLRKPIALRDTQMHRERRSARGLVSALQSQIWTAGFAGCDTQAVQYLGALHWMKSARTTESLPC